MQKPHPRIWIPGIWAAKLCYPDITLATPVERMRQIWQMDDDAAAQVGFTGRPERHCPLKQIRVADAEEGRSRTPAPPTYDRLDLM